MKRLLTYAAGLLLLAGVSFSVAQNVNKSVQLSQDASGPVLFDSLNGIYFPGKLYVTNNQTAPTLQTCGTSPSVAGTDSAGQVVEGSGAVTSCAITFSRAWAATPYCFAQSTSQPTPVGMVATPNGITFTHVSSSVSMPINYFCIGKQP
jgi:hypothetical protein